MSLIEHKLLTAIDNIEDKVGENPLKDKWVSIMGDSISTYEGWNYNEGNTYYPKSDVDDVSKMWWHQLLTKCGAKLCVNASFGASCVQKENNGIKSGLQRADDICRHPGETYINLDGTTELCNKEIRPDFVIIFMGINDFINNVPLGEYNYLQYESPTSFNADTFYKAYANLMLKCSFNKTAAAFTTNIIIIPPLASNFTVGYNSNNKASPPYSQDDLNEAIRKVAHKWRIPVIGVDEMNSHVGQDVVNQIDKLHPKAMYHKAIADKAFKDINNMVFLLQK